MYCGAVQCKFGASIFRIERQAQQETSSACCLLLVCFLFGLLFTRKMDAGISSGTQMNFYTAIPGFNAEGMLF
jgi:hypothetical protein